MGKYAVVIGVNYVKNPEAALEGCCNDARLMIDMLKTKGFEDDDIKILIDDDDSYDSPDHVNVKKALNWLCTGREDGDIIFMHFSGHGTQIPADDDDVEIDKLDEAICLEELFLMADDDLKQFFAQLPDGARATVVMDCCHSGSMLDGTEVVIEGAKDTVSAAPHQESASLTSILGGVGGSANRSLPLSTICNVMSQKLGTEVPPTGTGVNGAMAQVFGGTAGKLMLKFAMSQLNKQEGGSAGGSGLMGMLGGALGGSSGGSGGNPLSALMGGGGSATRYGEETSSSSNPLGALMGGGGSSGGSNPLSALMGGGSSGGGNPLSSLLGGGGAEQPSQQQDPMSKLSGLMGGLGLQGTQSSSAAPTYNPNHKPLSDDVCTLITGCQADETSADVRPRGGGAHGALTKTLTDVERANPGISFYDLVSQVRAELSKGGFKQNPCLETSMDIARTTFICE